MVGYDPVCVCFALFDLCGFTPQTDSGANLPTLRGVDRTANAPQSSNNGELSNWSWLCPVLDESHVSCTSDCVVLSNKRSDASTSRCSWKNFYGFEFSRSLGKNSNSIPVGMCSISQPVSMETSTLKDGVDGCSYSKRFPFPTRGLPVLTIHK